MTLTRVSSLMRQKQLLEEVIHLLTKLGTCANYSIIDDSDLDTMQKIMSGWNRATWEEILTEDDILKSYYHG